MSLSAPQDFFDYIMIQTFIDGIRDEELQQVFRLGNSKKLEELVPTLKFETAKQTPRNKNTKLFYTPSSKLISPISEAPTEWECIYYSFKNNS